MMHAFLIYSKSLNMYNRVKSCLNEVATSYIYLKEYAVARKYLQEALDVTNENDSILNKHLPVILNKLAMTYYAVAITKKHYTILTEL